ncbi:MAG: hypothetical protein DKM50_12140 [Candidatus Margulisiibacteriota bacterium]|nr:MAG: hypothetical protein A2X43_00935 [Candidatus Margulisbacteria bacterium GWD2_39_127]OGI02394.1 MAG: hypothetical protein A2X42_09585 [Candidatus Margulisbacteria bacterium GWF2_38_17]OGI08526.1 MAG: hypothetical protein A2X41_07370 [Candidatus Margulisbacteria bacterium GWE2_39_32]PZM78176.1 MAG: hypothetical protein DKM50_12140 [Candidatus Margulisiibacteriota bacterium]HAR63437.1 hypothetical protein [Candidatus Margulisiibacteriota bacterium]
MNIKSRILTATLLLFVGSAVMAVDNMSGKGTGGVSIISSGGKSATVLTLSPTLGIGNFGFGLDVNLFMPAENKPKNASFVSIRYVEYDDGINGIRYGVLSGITLGYGLIMNDYSTEVNGSTIFDPSKAGVKAYTNAFNPYGMMAVITNTKVYAGRLTYQPAELELLGKQVKLGLSYAVDNDGVSNTAGTIGKGQAAMAADAGWLVFGDAGTLFVEVGQLINYSKGGMTGVKGKVFNFLDYQVDYRTFGSKFVPGYFNYQYELSPTDLETVNLGSMSGYHGSLGFSIFNLANFIAEYQNIKYKNKAKEDPSLKAILTVNEIAGVSAQARYEQVQMTSFSKIGSGGANIAVDTYAPLTMLGVNFPGNAKITWKRVYNDQGQMEDSTEYGYAIPFKF